MQMQAIGTNYSQKNNKPSFGFNSFGSQKTIEMINGIGVYDIFDLRNIYTNLSTASNSHLSKFFQSLFKCFQDPEISKLDTNLLAFSKSEHDKFLKLGDPKGKTDVSEISKYLSGLIKGKHNSITEERIFPYYSRFQELHKQEIKFASEANHLKDDINDLTTQIRGINTDLKFVLPHDSKEYQKLDLLELRKQAVKERDLIKCDLDIHERPIKNADENLERLSKLANQDDPEIKRQIEFFKSSKAFHTGPNDCKEVDELKSELDSLNLQIKNIDNHLNELASSDDLTQYTAQVKSLKKDRDQLMEKRSPMKARLEDLNQQLTSTYEEMLKIKDDVKQILEAA